jgi:hypothetical protein
LQIHPLINLKKMSYKIGVCDPSGAAATWRANLTKNLGDLYTPASTAAEYRFQGNQPKIQNAYNYKKQVSTGIRGTPFDQQNDENYWQSKQIQPNINRPLGSGLRNAAIINEGVYNINPIAGTNSFDGGVISAASGLNPMNYTLVNTDDIEDRLRAHAVPASNPLSAEFAKNLTPGAKMDPLNVEGDAMLNTFRSDNSLARNAKTQVYDKNLMPLNEEGTAFEEPFTDSNNSLEYARLARLNATANTLSQQNPASILSNYRRQLANDRIRSDAVDDMDNQDGGETGGKNVFPGGGDDKGPDDEGGNDPFDPRGGGRNAFQTMQNVVAPMNNSGVINAKPLKYRHLRNLSTTSNSSEDYYSPDTPSGFLAERNFSISLLAGIRQFMHQAGNRVASMFTGDRSASETLHTINTTSSSNLEFSDVPMTPFRKESLDISRTPTALRTPSTIGVSASGSSDIHFIDGSSFSGSSYDNSISMIDGPGSSASSTVVQSGGTGSTTQRKYNSSSEFSDQSQPNMTSAPITQGRGSASRKDIQSNVFTGGGGGFKKKSMRMRVEVPVDNSMESVHDNSIFGSLGGSPFTPVYNAITAARSAFKTHTSPIISGLVSMLRSQGNETADAVATDIAHAAGHLESEEDLIQLMLDTSDCLSNESFVGSFVDHVTSNPAYIDPEIISENAKGLSKAIRKSATNSYGRQYEEEDEEYTADQIAAFDLLSAHLADNDVAAASTHVFRPAEAIRSMNRSRYGQNDIPIEHYSAPGASVKTPSSKLKRTLFSPTPKKAGDQANMPADTPGGEEEVYQAPWANSPYSTQKLGSQVNTPWTNTNAQPAHQHFGPLSARSSITPHMDIRAPSSFTKSGNITQVPTNQLSIDNNNPEKQMSLGNLRNRLVANAFAAASAVKEALNNLGVASPVNFFTENANIENDYNEDMDQMGYVDEESHPQHTVTPTKSYLKRGGGQLARGQTTPVVADRISMKKGAGVTMTPTRNFMQKGSGRGAYRRVASVGKTPRVRTPVEITSPKPFLRKGSVMHGGGPAYREPQPRSRTPRPQNISPTREFLPKGGGAMKGAAYMRVSSVTPKQRQPRDWRRESVTNFLRAGEGKGGRNVPPQPRAMAPPKTPPPVQSNFLRKGTGAVMPPPPPGPMPMAMQQAARRHAIMERVAEQAPAIVTDLMRIKSVTALANIVEAYNEMDLLPLDRQGLETFRDIFHSAVPYIHLTGIQGDAYSTTFHIFRNIENARRDRDVEDNDVYLYGDFQREPDPDYNTIRYDVNAYWRDKKGKFKRGVTQQSLKTKHQKVRMIGQRGSSTVDLSMIGED